LLRHATGRSKSWLLAHGETMLKKEQTHTLRISLEHLLKGVPLPYILGSWDFYGRTFKVTPDVLIPRPETELLVEIALKLTCNRENLSIVDVGTGSGIIAISLAAELPGATMIALDLSSPALSVAQENARRHAQSQIHFVQSNLLTPFNTQFHLICANLPYIPSYALDTLDVAKTEPRLALDGGESGLLVIGELLRQARTRLAASGTILLEIEASLGQAALTAAHEAFPEANNQLIRDLSGKDRIVKIQQR
jgi:release factor glutamine methyltransferase